MGKVPRVGIGVIILKSKKVLLLKRKMHMVAEVGLLLVGI